MLGFCSMGANRFADIPDHPPYRDFNAILRMVGWRSSYSLFRSTFGAVEVCFPIDTHGAFFTWLGPGYVQSKLDRSFSTDSVWRFDSAFQTLAKHSIITTSIESSKLVMWARPFGFTVDKDFKSFARVFGMRRFRSPFIGLSKLKRLSMLFGLKRCLRDIHDKITSLVKNFFWPVTLLARRLHRERLAGRYRQFRMRLASSNYADRSRQMVEDGDRNSKFFHSLLRSSHATLSSLIGDKYFG
ncbi:hypothetical protein FNV43_RR19919 [Rhamnella rubrinervis]|uniref:Uncharacterized protein n=1 Tax=Rhamnella rubrinervis TaxID=2594499 RepID=A0A8K0DUZ1_9ROSA|nr:hypothetical protein FNV43_RR19919 [Rhamnella rubrinervis]